MSLRTWGFSLSISSVHEFIVIAKHDKSLGSILDQLFVLVENGKIVFFFFQIEFHQLLHDILRRLHFIKDGCQGLRPADWIR
ncbi:MAG: hypothetical protein ACI87E_001707 [Mariniblastus sp.]|jgi:hypothetical protein